MKKAFTMIELIYVIVILGILSAVALPKFAATRNMADVSKARTDVAAIRASILTERQSQLIIGNVIDPWIPQLSATVNSLFTGNGGRTLLTYGIVAGVGAGEWAATNLTGNVYTFTVDTQAVQFDYNKTSGLFTCDRGTTAPSDVQKICKKIID